MQRIDFEQIFRQAPMAFSIVDLDGHQIDGSDRYWKLFGIDPSSIDVDDAVIARLTDTPDAEITRRYFDDLASGATDEVVIEKRYRRTNGELFWGRLQAGPIVGVDGTAVAIAGVITDISAERDARDALVDSEVERSRSDDRAMAEAIRTFVGGVEHDVRSPLHSILGLTELLAQGDTLTSEQRLALHAEALRLQTIIEEISAFSSNELGLAGAGSPERSFGRLDEQWASSLEAATDRRRSAAIERTMSARSHVLVVDDSEVNRLLAVSQLQRLGYSSATACNGLEAVERAADDHFDAILMDWHMPVLDGVDAARRIRRNEPGGTRVPIIAITAAVVAGDRSTCLAAGMDDVLIKPVTIEMLDAALRRRIAHAPERMNVLTSTPPPHHRSSIDPRALQELERETGDRSVVGVIIDTYLDELDQRLDSIGSSAEGSHRGSSDAARELARSAHTLKSTASLVGATRLSHLCEQLELLAADRLGPEAEQLADAVITEARRTAIDLQPLRSAL